MCDHDWVNVAMSDDTLVVDVLLRLHHPPPPPPPPPPPSAVLQLHWTVRQRRSKSVPRQAARASPTTPLSWSAATSASGDSHADTSRSKVANPSETATTKKSRRKKTLAELREEESVLLKEKRSLKNELASLRLIVEEHRATNESLKRMKLDLESQQKPETTTSSDVSKKAVYDPIQFVEAQYHPSNSVIHKVLDDNSSHVCVANVSSKANDNSSTFVLPDLNLPVEEDFNTNAMH